MAKEKFKHIILIGRPGIKGVPETLRTLIDYLSSMNVKFCIEKSSHELVDNANVPVVNRDSLPKDADLILVVGGDGSLLNAAHIALQNDLPVLGINRGRLGFLTDIYPNELDKIREVLNGNYEDEERFLLFAEITHDKKTLYKNIALNDVVLMLGDIPQMIEFETYINERFVCSQRADGLIIATPTGSTAYALSGGGPILHPNLNAIVLVPMFPHTLSSRPIVVEANTKTEICISKNNEDSPYVSCDGLERKKVPPGGSIHIKRYEKTLRLIHPEDYSYFGTLREKLGWERHAYSHPH